MVSKKQIVGSFFAFVFLYTTLYGQGPFRYGTTAASFLELGVGSAAVGMGEATVAAVNDVSSVYWNPAGLGHVRGFQSQFMYQPWIADINTTFVGLAYNAGRYGVFGLSIYQIDYGSMDVTTLEYQGGTGEKFGANEYSLSFTYGKRLVQWFSFGFSTKLITSQIWHSTASAVALDLGVLINTQFLSATGDRENGLVIGMSITNYGSRLKYDGMDLLVPIDISPYEEGNYSNVTGQFTTGSWDLPLLFRLGVKVKPIVKDYHELAFAVDALHPTNNSEHLNIGLEYKLKSPGFGSFFIRCGQKALFMDSDDQNRYGSSEYGTNFGLGLNINFLNNITTTIDYAYKSLGILGGVNLFTITFSY